MSDIEEWSTLANWIQDNFDVNHREASQMADTAIQSGPNGVSINNGNNNNES